jgi:hypothetical protein
MHPLAFAEKRRVLITQIKLTLRIPTNFGISGHPLERSATYRIVQWQGAFYDSCVEYQIVNPSCMNFPRTEVIGKYS